MPPLGAGRSAELLTRLQSLSGRSPLAFPWPAPERPERQRHGRPPKTICPSDHVPDRGAEPRGTPDRSKLFGSHGQRPGFHGMTPRRIRRDLDQPTRDKEKDLFLLTDVPRERADARTLAE